MSARATTAEPPTASEDLVAVLDAPPTGRTGAVGAGMRLVTHLVDVVAPLLDRWVGEGARWSRLPQGRRVAVGWVITRAVMLALLALPEQTVISDVTYYFDNLHELGLSGNLHGALHEYPLPVLVLVGIPYLFSFGNHLLYDTLFVVMMLAFDAAFCRLLFRFGGRRQTAAVTLWLAAGPMMGPLAVTRFDIVPGMLAGAAVLLVATRPRLAALFITTGAALKLWPAVLIPALAAPRATRWRVLSTAVVAGGVVVAASLAVGGVQRLLSPLTWQSQRGLQVESLPAWPLMAAWSVFREPWLQEFSRFVSQEIHGPGGRLMVTLSTLPTWAALAVMAVLWVRAWHRGNGAVGVGAETVGWLVLTSTGLLILSNKVFSPQYLLWLSPVAIAMVALAPRSDTGVRRFTVLLLMVGVLTQVIYPITYLWVVGIYWANPIGVAMLGLRDIALIGFVWYAARRTWNETSTAQGVTVERTVTA
jgi:Glycosyltransferase family 87